jgi:hypothetical protein
MPVVAIVDGMLIMFFFNDHDPHIFMSIAAIFAQK